MKFIAKLLLIFFLTMSWRLFAQQTCHDYIDNKWPDIRYTAESLAGDYVVTDNKTNLMWKQCSEGLSGSDCLAGTLTTPTWEQALIIPETMNSTTGYAGYYDWRLPNVEELRSLASINCYNPAINDAVFPNTPSNGFWSSSPNIVSDRKARIIDFNEGNDVNVNRDTGSFVRLVRGPEQ